MTTLNDQLMQQMLGGELPDPESISRMFAEHPDPRIRLIARMINNQGEAQSSGNSIEGSGDTAVLDEGPEPTLPSIRLQRQYRYLKEELRVARTIGDTLAAALGACYLCWGEDAECEACAGAGRPGWAAPDRELFVELVVPAIQRYRRHPRPTSPATQAHATP